MFHVKQVFHLYHIDSDMQAAYISTEIKTMSAEVDEFFDDSDALQAAERLRGQLDFFPETLATVGEKKFDIPFPLFRDAVLASTLKGTIATGERLHVAVNANSLILNSQYRGVAAWAIVRLNSGAQAEHFFSLSRSTAAKISALRYLSSIPAQVVCDNEGAVDELRLKLASARVRLKIARAEHMPADTASGEFISFDPVQLRRALRDALWITATSPGCDQIIRADGGRIYAGGQKATIVMRAPGFSELQFEISAEDATPLARVIGRMHGKIRFCATDEHYTFSDGLFTCRVKRSKGQHFPIDAIESAQPTHSFVSKAFDAITETYRCEIPSPETLELEWPAVTLKGTVEANALSVKACSVGRIDNCRGLIAASSQMENSPVKTVVDAAAWIAAVRLAAMDGRVEFAMIKAGKFLKVVVSSDDYSSAVYMPNVSALHA